MPVPRSPLGRIWHGIPDVVFRVLGAGFFLAYVAFRVRYYLAHWPFLGLFYYDGGRRVPLPFVHVLVDATFLLIAIGYLVRTRPRQRASGISEVVLPFIAAFWPMMPSAFQWLDRSRWLAETESGTAGWVTAWLRPLWAEGEVGPVRFWAACGAMVFGSVLDLWGYWTLRRSLSIVAEAREMVTHGPYRWVRHPVYLGQFIAQAGVWLLLRPWHPLRACYYLIFVLMQLFRARVEERVLERHFGAPFEQWKRRTWWFP
ncbi:MAG: isoprenylcysteine carboxylmethyltransferase family protein [Phycisphaerae bacterium]|nr:hypothetical protein [Phycisphaerae bacterium]NUQ45816.1 isoprenylcysteine carboxylmethyltransferase family protein [Phycisphaerae bacterium]